MPHIKRHFPFEENYKHNTPYYSHEIIDFDGKTGMQASKTIFFFEGWAISIVSLILQHWFSAKAMTDYPKEKKIYQRRGCYWIPGA